MEMKLTSVKSCYEESPPCQRVGFWREGRKKKNHREPFFNYETSGNQGAEGEEREEGKEAERKKERHIKQTFFLL